MPRILFATAALGTSVEEGSFVRPELVREASWRRWTNGCHISFMLCLQHWGTTGRGRVRPRVLWVALVCYSSLEGVLRASYSPKWALEAPNIQVLGPLVLEFRTGMEFWEHFPDPNKQRLWNIHLFPRKNQDSLVYGS